MKSYEVIVNMYKHMTTDERYRTFRMADIPEPWKFQYNKKPLPLPPLTNAHIASLEACYETVMAERSD